MRLAFPPVFILALLIALIATQAAYLGAPGKPAYLVRLALSLGAVAAGEALAALGIGPRWSLGDVHLLHDLALLAAVQLAATRWARRRLDPHLPR